MKCFPIAIRSIFDILGQLQMGVDMNLDKNLRGIEPILIRDGLFVFSRLTPHALRLTVRKGGPRAIEW